MRGRTQTTGRLRQQGGEKRVAHCDATDFKDQRFWRKKETGLAVGLMNEWKAGWMEIYAFIRQLSLKVKISACWIQFYLVKAPSFYKEEKLANLAG